MVSIFLYLFQYTGAFRSVAVGTDERGPYTLIYLDHSGAYHKIVENINTVEKWAKENNLNCRFTFGEFFDDPEIVEEGRLKSRAGCLFDPPIAMTVQLPEKFKTAEFPKTKSVVALFNGSPGIGPYKVYPKAQYYMRERKLVRSGSVMEIYEVLDGNNMRTTYLWPIL